MRRRWEKLRQKQSHQQEMRQQSLGGTQQPEWMLRNPNARGAMSANSDEDVTDESRRSFFKRLIPRSCRVEVGEQRQKAYRGGEELQ